MKQMQVALQDGDVRDMFRKQRGRRFLVGGRMVGGTDSEHRW